MIDTTRLLPPGYGPSTNPVLFGVSDGLARWLPLPDDDFAALYPVGTGGEGIPAARTAAEPAPEAVSTE